MLDINTGDLVSTFDGADNGFQNPHDIAVSVDGSAVYEVELNPYKVWKLTNGENGGVEVSESDRNKSWLSWVGGLFG